VIAPHVPFAHPKPAGRGESLGQELAWLLAQLPGESRAYGADDIDDDRVAAIVATALLALPADRSDEAISRAMAAVGLQRKVDRVFYYRLDEAAGEVVLTHEWHAEAVRPLRSAPKFVQMGVDVLPPPVLARLRDGGMLCLPRTRQLLGSPVDELVSPDGDRAVALAPVVVDGSLIGVAGFAANCGSTWTDSDLDLLRVVAQGVARAVDRRRAHEALRVSEDRFRAMCDASPLGIFIAGPKGECRYANPALQRIMDLTAEEAAGQGWMRHLHPEDRERISAKWGSAVEAGRDYATPVHRFVHRDGSIRHVEVRAIPYVGSLGDKAFLGVMEDVTARVRAQQEAEAARTEIANILSRISDAFIALDTEGRYTYANERAVALAGRPREELIGRTPWELFPVAGPALRQAFLRAVESEDAVTVEMPSSAGRWCEARLYPSPTGMSVFFEDISDRKREKEQLRSDRDYLRQEVGGLDAFAEVIGADNGLRRLMDTVAMVAATNTNVLITGETGTGKELIARAIHENSPRRERLLVKVNCAAISAGLVESELFGHERGAFTGAVQRRKGRFELASGGTLFLDEVGELPLETQVKLLRVLQEREFERVGGSETIRVDVRVVAATNRDLPEMVERGRFREDLYYRLAVFPVALPPLRERAGDIPLLVQSFVRRFARQSGRRIDGVSPEAMRRLCGYHWPGNVRELQNVIERAVVLSRHPILDLASLPSLPTPSDVTPGPVVPSSTIEDVQRGYVAKVLAETSWVIEGERGAARKLGVHPNTLRSRLKRWGLVRPHVS
jgi:PAS domain S-box-containing protein